MSPESVQPPHPDQVHDQISGEGAKYIAAMRVGFFTRWWKLSVLDPSLAILVAEANKNAFLGVQRLLGEITAQDLLPAEVRRSGGWGGVRTAITSVERYDLPPLYPYADQLLSPDSVFRPWYDLGRFLGHCALEMLEGHDDPSHLEPLRVAIGSLPRKMAAQTPVLSSFLALNEEVPTLKALRQAIERTGHRDRTPITITSRQSVFVEFLDAVVRDFCKAWRSNALEFPAASNTIPPKHRTKPLTYRKAAALIGKGNSRDAAEWLSKSVKDGSYRCEHVSRQLHIFDKRQFPSAVWPKIEPSDGNWP